MKRDRKFEPIEISPGVIIHLRRCQSDSVGVVEEKGACRLVAVRRIAAGTPLFRIEGETTHQPTRYTVQIDEGLHIDLGTGHSEEQILDEYYWRFTNHSCEPNTVIRSREVIASRDIETWSDVTFDYNTTEYEIAEPFDCHCGSSRCLGRIKGFRHLTSDQREHLRPLLARHLSRLLGPGAELNAP
jgi:hypothetical protein